MKISDNILHTDSVCLQVLKLFFQLEKIFLISKNMDAAMFEKLVNYHVREVQFDWVECLLLLNLTRPLLDKMVMLGGE